MLVAGAPAAVGLEVRTLVRGVERLLARALTVELVELALAVLGHVVDALAVLLRRELLRVGAKRPEPAHALKSTAGISRASAHSQEMMRENGLGELRRSIIARSRCGSRDQHTRRVAKRGAMKLTSREEMMDDDDRVLTDMGLQIEESWAEEGIEDELPTAAANPNAVLDAEALIPEPSPCTFATAGANGNPTRSGGNEHEAMDWVLGYSAKPA